MTNAREVLDRAMSEAELQRTVTEMLTAFGWRWCHFRPARTEKGWRTPMAGQAGWPDIFALRDQKALAIELKSQRGALTEAQAEWMWALVAAGISYAVWRSSDLSDGTIERVLRGVE